MKTGYLLIASYMNQIVYVSSLIHNNKEDCEESGEDYLAHHTDEEKENVVILIKEVKIL